MSSSHLNRMQLCSNKRSVTTPENVEERESSSSSDSRTSQACTRTLRTHFNQGSLFPAQIAMPLKNGNTVAAERRMDLASFFCMIGRHGPAVALAAIAMVSLLAGFILYRTVRGKRRKATAAAADDDDKSPEAERDPSVIRQSPGESHSSMESTDVSPGSSDVKGDIDVIQSSDLKIRHRRAADKTPPPYSPPKSDIRVSGNKYATSDDTEEVAIVWDSYIAAETYADEANHSRQSDAYTEAEMVAEEAVDCHQGATDDAVKDVLEEVHDNNSCWKEPEPINEKNKEDNKVLKSEWQDHKDATTGKDVSDNTAREEEEDFQSTSNNPVYFEQTPAMSEIYGNDQLQDDKTTNSVGLEEPVIHVEDVSVPCVCFGKDEEFVEEKQDSIDYSCFSGNDHQSPEEAEEECVDLHAEIWSTTFEQKTNLQTYQEEQCDHVTGELAPSTQESDCRKDRGALADIVIDDDCLNKITAVKFEFQMPQLNKQDVEIEEIEKNGPMCEEKYAVLFNDQVNETILTGDDIVPCIEERDCSSVSLSSALPCFSKSIKVDYKDDGSSNIATDAEAQISSVVDFPDFSLDCQHPQAEDNLAGALDEETDFIILGSKMMSHETENELDQVNDSNVQSCHEEEQSVPIIRNEAFDKESPAADSDTVENLTASVISEEISCPLLPSICQEQQSGHEEVNKTFDETIVDSSIDVAACSYTSCTAHLCAEEISCPALSSSFHDQQMDQMEKNKTFGESEVNSLADESAYNTASLTSPVMSEDLSFPGMSSSQDQQIDQTKNNYFSEVTTGAAPVLIKDLDPPECQIHLPSFEQFERRDDDILCAGVGEESGISSMTVSPDAGQEFDVIFENVVLPVMDFESQMKAQNSFFTDDAVISMIKEDTGDMIFGPYPLSQSQPPHSEHTGCESLAANEDIFGHEVEDSYHRAMDQFMVQIADNATGFTSELGKQTDVKAEVKEKEVRVSVEKKEEAKGEEQKEEDYEKTEISIMEATMDHNEWIMDSNYQPLPWMNLSATSFTHDQTKTSQLSTKESSSSSAITVTTCTDATDIPPTTEISTLSFVDESTENYKKVQAVQPMPQNVNVTFRVHYVTQSPYQTVAVTGNPQELGNWKGFIPLERAKDGHWATVVSLPAESIVEWKFVLVDKGEVCRWEECGNRLLDTGSGDDLLVHKWWGRL